MHYLYVNTVCTYLPLSGSREELSISCRTTITMVNSPRGQYISKTSVESFQNLVIEQVLGEQGEGRTMLSYLLHCTGLILLPARPLARSAPTFLVAGCVRLRAALEVEVRQR